MLLLSDVALFCDYNINLQVKNMDESYLDSLLESVLNPKTKSEAEEISFYDDTSAETDTYAETGENVDTGSTAETGEHVDTGSTAETDAEEESEYSDYLNMEALDMQRAMTDLAELNDLLIKADKNVMIDRSIGKKIEAFKKAEKATVSAPAPKMQVLNSDKFDTKIVDTEEAELNRLIQAAEKEFVSESVKQAVPDDKTVSGDYEIEEIKDKIYFEDESVTRNAPIMEEAQPDQNVEAASEPVSDAPPVQEPAELESMDLESDYEDPIIESPIMKLTSINSIVDKASDDKEPLAEDSGTDLPSASSPMLTQEQMDELMSGNADSSDEVTGYEENYIDKSGADFQSDPNDISVQDQTARLTEMSSEPSYEDSSYTGSDTEASSYGLKRSADLSPVQDEYVDGKLQLSDLPSASSPMLTQDQMDKLMSGNTDFSDEVTSYGESYIDESGADLQSDPNDISVPDQTAQLTEMSPEPSYEDSSYTGSDTEASSYGLKRSVDFSPVQDEYVDGKLKLSNLPPASSPMLTQEQMNKLMSGNADFSDEGTSYGETYIDESGADLQSDPNDISVQDQTARLTEMSSEPSYEDSSYTGSDTEASSYGLNRSADFSPVQDEYVDGKLQLSDLPSASSPMLTQDQMDELMSGNADSSDEVTSYEETYIDESGTDFPSDSDSPETSDLSNYTSDELTAEQFSASNIESATLPEQDQIVEAADLPSDPNAILTPEQIAQLTATNNISADKEVEVETAMSDLPSNDSNELLTPEEIAALTSAANEEPIADNEATDAAQSEADTAEADIENLDALMDSLKSDDLGNLEGAQNTVTAEKEGEVEETEVDSEKVEPPKVNIIEFLDGMSENDTDELPEAGGKNKKKKAQKDGKKKPGLIAWILSFFSSNEEDDNEAVDDDLGIASLTDENKRVLNELAEEEVDKKNKKKAKEKKPKPKKEKKPKAKKAAKPPKLKKPESVQDDGPPEKRIPFKRIAVIAMFAITMGILLLLPAMLLPDFITVQDAVSAYKEGDYARTYKELYGRKNLNEEAQKAYNNASCILKMQNYYDSYKLYKSSGMEVEALNALIKGVVNYKTILDEAAATNDASVQSHVSVSYGDIVSTLNSEYNISEAEAKELFEIEDRILYTYNLQKLLGLR